MKFDIRLQPAGEPLAPEIGAFLASVFVDEGFTSAEAGRAAFEGAALVARGTAWIASSDPLGSVVGTIFLAEPTSWYRQIAVPGELEVHLMAVAPPYRGSGVADALVRACVAEGRSRGAERLVLSTQPMMLAAHRLYERHGFVRNPSRDWTRPGRPYWAYELALRT